MLPIGQLYRTRPRLFIFSACLAACVFPGSAAKAQFFATPEASGELSVVDEGGAPVNVVTADPVGTRPDNCPTGAYHVAELPTDTSQLVLTDCATGQGQYAVEMGTPDSAGD